MSKLVLEKNLELPKGWIETKAKDVFNIPSGKTPNNIDLYKKSAEIPFFKVADMNNLENIPFMKISKINLTANEIFELKLKPFPKGTIIFPKRGGAIKTNKKRILHQPSCVDLNIMGLVSDIIIPEFTYHWINSFDLSQISDGSNVPQINLKNIEPLVFPLPPLSEQKRIVKKIEELFLELGNAKITLEKIKLQLVQYKHSLLKSLFEGKHTVKWEVKKLGDSDVSEIIMGQSPPSSTYNKEKKGMPFFQGKKDFGEKFPIATIWCTKPRKVAKKGDILLSVRAPVGDTNWADEECCIGRGLSAIRVKIEPEYVYYFLKLIKTKLSRSGVGSVFNALNKNELYQISLRIPPSSKQREIISQIQQGFSIIENTENITHSMLIQITALRLTLLKQVFQGKLVPQDPKDEPAENLLQKIKQEKEKLEQKQKLIKAKLNQHKRKRNVK